jgi:hypothetical protein
MFHDPNTGGRRSPNLPHPKFPISYWGLEHFLPLTPYQAVFPLLPKARKRSAISKTRSIWMM